jgi:predicted DsbA family dithiol-disulfide isomerase
MKQGERSHSITIDCFSDVLCVWAYVAQIRIDELQAVWGDQINLSHHYINLFGSTAHRIGEGWSERGGYEGFAAHVLEVCEAFPHLEVNPAIWRKCRPLGAGNAHLILKAVQNMERMGEAPDGAAQALAWRVRLAFFRDALDVGDWRVLLALAQEQELGRDAIEQRVLDGTAMADLARDQELRDQHTIAGSPTYLLNNGRQKLFGNVGYRVLEANVRELLEHPGDQVSWC